MNTGCRLAGLFLFSALTMAPVAGWSVVVSSVGALQTAVDSANSGGDKNILIADGVYDMRGVALFITMDGVTVRSASGNRSRVVLDSQYVEGGTSGIFRIVSSSVTIADLTLKRPHFHAIHISPAAGRSTQNVQIRNVHIIDPGEQAIKINPDDPDSATYTVNNGTIKNCLIELTDAGRTQLTSEYPCYTGGIDGHWAANWTVQDNVIRGFWCSDALSEHGIHFWNNSSNIVVERNKVIDCDRGIGFGLGSDGNTGGIIRNNMIYHGPDHGYSDVGISLESTPDAQVYNNTVFHEHAYAAIEYRFAATTDTLIANNLTNRAIDPRDLASGTESHNLTTALAAWFTNTTAGDLHLASAVGSVVDQGEAVPGLTDDFDRGVRPYGAGYDIGADEYGAGPPLPPSPPPVVPEGVNMAPVLHLLGDRDEREVLHQDFEVWPPAGWSIVNNDGDCVWESNDATGEDNHAGGEGMAAAANADDCGSGKKMNTELRSTVIDLSMAESAQLSYVASYDDSPSGTGENADYADVDISTDGGITWTNLLRWAGSDHDRIGPGEAVTIDLTPYTGSIFTVIRFHYYAPEWDWWWMIDQVKVTRK
jgi:hypothetical protein